MGDEATEPERDGRAYEAPAIRSLGNVEELTGVADGSSIDA